MGIIEGDKNLFKPTHEYYVKRRVEWVSAIDGSEEHSGMGQGGGV